MIQPESQSVFFDSIGCRLNQAEMESLAAEFLASGFDLAKNVEAADLVVINTCSVTKEADRDSRQKVRQVHARNARAGIALTGCWSTLEPEAAANLPGVRWVVPNDEKQRLAEYVLANGSFSTTARWRHVPRGSPRSRTRAFLPVQLGCDHVCAYCVTRLARGAAKSVPADQVVRSILAAEEAGALEAVLTGVQLGAWGKDLFEPDGLRKLLNTILAGTSIPRIRLSSVEPWNVNADLLRVWEDPRMCPQLHLPLQSGCAATLRRMKRPCSPEVFAQQIAKARAAIPGLAVTTDLMVGFPGETREEFEETLAFVRQMQFARLHIFHFSPRPGTDADLMKDRIPPEERRARVREAKRVGDESTAAFLQEYLGREVEVLWEAGDGCGHYRGGARNGISVRIDSNAPLRNQLSKVRISEIVNGEARADSMPANNVDDR
jgi:threonylcarbamoyladenosine tRNA methylthiotransferase MtaB